MVFAPHPDDETLGCGGTILKSISEGKEVKVVVMTDGRFALKIFNILSRPTPEELKIIRRNELSNALKVMGVREQSLFCLDFFDTQLERNEEAAVKRVSEILASNPPAEVYFTSSEDASSDHRATCRIVQKAIRLLEIDAVKYQYSIWRRLERFVLMKDRWLNLIRHDLIYLDISEFLLEKEAAIREYKSQTGLISPKQDKAVLRRALVDLHLDKYEIFRRS